MHILEKYILTLCTQTQRYAEQFNRTEANLHDLGLVFRDIHIPLQELREYTRCVPPVQCHLNVSNFPLPKESRLNFLKPGSQEVLTRPVHVHEYLPAMFPEKEKDSAPPIASTVEITHNGTDAQHEACKSPEISVTDVDKQKDIFKRPNDPVSLTPPGLKRPRLKLEEEDCHTREISSVMMTMSGFLSPAREGKLPEARTPVIVHDTHPEKAKSNPHHPPAPPHPSAPPHPERSEKKSKKNKALNGKIDKGKKKEKAHKNIPTGKQKNAENRNNKLAMHLARGKVRPSGSVKHHAGEMPPLKQVPLSLDTNSRPIKQEEIEKPAVVPPVPFNPALQPPPLVQIHKNPPQQYHKPQAISEPLLPPNITIKEEVIESEKLTSQPDRSKLNIFKKISSKIKEERHSDTHDRFVHDNGAIKIEKSISRCSSPTLVIDEPDISRKMAHVNESIDFVVSNSVVGHSTSSNSAVDLTSKRANPVVNDVINVDEDSNEFRKHIFKQELSDDLPKDLSKPKLNAVHNLPPSPIVKEKKERKRRERKPKPDKALKEYTKMLKKQQLEKMQSMDAAHAEMKFNPRLAGFPMFPLIPGAGPGLIPGGVFSGFIPPNLRGLLPPDTPSLLPNPYSMAPGASGNFNRQDFLQSVPGLIPPNISNPLLSHLNHSFGKPPHMPQHPNISSFLRRPSLEVIPIEDDVIPQAPTKKSKQSYLSPPLVIKEKEKLDKSRISPNSSMIVNNISAVRTSPVKQSPPKPNPVIKMPTVKPDITIKLNPPEKVKVVDVPKPKPEPVLSEEPILPIKEKEKDKSERKKDKLHKKEKKDKELKIKKKKDKKDKLKIKIEKKKEKEERHDSKEKSKKEKKEKRKEKEKTSPLTIAEGLVPKLTLKLGPASPMLPPSPEQARKLNIKPVMRKEEPVLSPVEPLPIPEDRLSAERSQSPELARISALVTRPPKSKPHHKHISPQVKAEPNPDLGRSLSPPPMPSNSSPTRKNRPPTFSKYKRIYFKPIPKRSDGSIIDLDQEEGPVPTKDVTMPEKFPNVPLGTPFYMDPQGNKVWICPACGRPDNGSPMIGCDGGCDGWYHWVCVGIRIAPDDTEDWYCTSCIAKKTAMVSAMAGGGQMAKKRGRKPKAEKSKEILLG